MKILSKTSRLLFGILSAGMILSISLTASKYIVKGVVTDAVDGTPCPGVIMRIYAENDSVLPLLSNITDSIGHFEQQLDSAGRYKLRTEFLGLKPEEMIFEVSDESPVADLDTITPVLSTEMLDEVVVSVRKPLVENDGATLTYNMTEDPEAQGNSILEMLRKVPMVTVDAEENIKVRGNSNFKIYLNGREDPMLSGDPKTILKSMPASTIKKVEVITEPGAKYDAEGVGGILNIVTITKQNLEGVVGNLNTWFTTNNVGESVYVRTKMGNVTGSVNISNSNSIFTEFCSNTNESRVENYLSEDNRSQITKGRSHYNSGFTGGGLSLSWEPDTLNLFTFDVYLGRYSSKSKNYQTMESLTSAGIMNWRLNRDYKVNNWGLWTNAGTSYQHTFGREGHHIVASYQYSFNHGGFVSNMETYDVEGYILTSPWRRNENTNHQNQHTLQIDYANPLGEHNVIEAGAKAFFMRSDNMSAPWSGNSADDMTVDKSEQVSMAQFRNIQAVYVSHTGNYGKWSTRAGLRYEHTETGIDYFSGPYDNFSSKSNDFVPNLSLTYRLTGMQNFRFAYQMRIFRPGVNVLNPYINTMTQGELSYGNPDLDSERNNEVNFSYNNYGGKVGGSARIAYSHTGNSIERFSFAEGGLIHNTYANIGKYNVASLSGDIQYSIIPSMTISFSGYAARVFYKLHTAMLTRSKTGWNWNYNANFNYRLPCAIAISAYGGQGSGWMNFETTGDGYHYYGLSVSRGFLKDEQLRINVYAQNFFEPRRTSSSSTTGENTYSYSTSRFRNINAGISISWQFGKLNADVKRTGAQIEAEAEAGEKTR